MEPEIICTGFPSRMKWPPPTVAVWRVGAGELAACRGSALQSAARSSAAKMRRARRGGAHLGAGRYPLIFPMTCRSTPNAESTKSMKAPGMTIDGGNRRTQSHCRYPLHCATGQSIRQPPSAAGHVRFRRSLKRYNAFEPDLTR